MENSQEIDPSGNAKRKALFKVHGELFKWNDAENDWTKLCADTATIGIYAEKNQADENSQSVTRILGMSSKTQEIFVNILVTKALELEFYNKTFFAILSKEPNGNDSEKIGINFLDVEDANEFASLTEKYKENKIHLCNDGESTEKDIEGTKSDVNEENNEKGKGKKNDATVHSNDFISMSKDNKNGTNELTNKGAENTTKKDETNESDEDVDEETETETEKSLSNNNEQCSQQNKSIQNTGEAFLELQQEFLLFKKEVLEDIGEIKSNLERLIKSLNDSL